MFYENVRKPAYASLVSQGLERVGDIPQASVGGIACGGTPQGI